MFWHVILFPLSPALVVAIIWLLRLRTDDTTDPTSTTLLWLLVFIGCCYDIWRIIAIANVPGPASNPVVVEVVLCIGSIFFVTALVCADELSDNNTRTLVNHLASGAETRLEAVEARLTRLEQRSASGQQSVRE